MQDEVVIITGTSRGLGGELARALELRSTKVIQVPLEEDLDALVGEVVQRYGKVDVLVNAASLECSGRKTPLALLPLKEFEKMINVNLTVPFRLTQRLIPYLQPGARIVNFTSEAAMEQRVGDGGVGATTLALEHLTRTFALENPDYGFYLVDPQEADDHVAARALIDMLAQRTLGYQFRELTAPQQAVLSA